VVEAEGAADAPDVLAALSAIPGTIRARRLS